jgi:hypothetical protein
VEPEAATTPRALGARCPPQCTYPRQVGRNQGCSTTQSCGSLSPISVSTKICFRTSFAESFEACPEARKHLGPTPQGAMNGIERVLLFRHNVPSRNSWSSWKQRCSLVRVQCAPLRRVSDPPISTLQREMPCGAMAVTREVFVKIKENKEKLTQAACCLVSDRSRPIHAAAPIVIGAFSA